MGITNSLQNGLSRIITIAGRPIRVIYFSETIDPVYDDDVTLTVSGNSFTSGIVLPLSNTQGSKDSLLLEQGKLQNDDMKLYLSGNIALTGSETQTRIQLGSNAGNSYELIGPGPILLEVAGTSIYKKAYIRRLNNGSLIGEI